MKNEAHTLPPPTTTRLDFLLLFKLDEGAYTNVVMFMRVKDASS